MLEQNELAGEEWAQRTDIRCKWPRLYALEQHTSALLGTAAIYSRASLRLFTCANLRATSGERTSSAERLQKWPRSNEVPQRAAGDGRVISGSQLIVFVGMIH